MARPVARGAAQPGQADTDAVAALAAALRERPLTVLALGPATNVAALLRQHPELAPRLTGVIAVAGRRPGQRFTTGSTNPRGHRDFNFELDPDAFATLLAADVPLTLALWTRTFGVNGFNPFDTLAVAVAATPASITCAPLPARIERGPDDVTEAAMQGDTPTIKPYLLVEAGGAGPVVRYCYRAQPDFAATLRARLLRAPAR